VVKRILTHFEQQKRRLYSIAFLAFSAGYVLYSHIDVMRYGMPVPVLTGLIYMGAIVCATVVTTYFLPGLTKVTDAVAVTRLGFALWIAATQSHELAASPVLGATVVVGGAIVLLQLSTWAKAMSQILSTDMPGPLWTTATPQPVAVRSA
jgi:hypothetical protein